MDCNLSDLTGLPFDPTFKLSCAVSNVICSIVFGKRYDYKDKKFLSLMNNMNNIFQMMNSRWGQVPSADISEWGEFARGAGGLPHREVGLHDACGSLPSWGSL
ncbi:hypothetical protein CIB84_017359 [Bambusicola thoracicus]|uniref:unspecific monooxygenase n=1 Tax=Bambusicola thoracicus TaxID=9083 RepID=A0A2P4S466_BAMTH|nr:hypothetical protein CIB84_017359 [Bambusicola thoracicus]